MTEDSHIGSPENERIKELQQLADHAVRLGFSAQDVFDAVTVGYERQAQQYTAVEADSPTSPPVEEKRVDAKDTDETYGGVLERTLEMVRGGDPLLIAKIDPKTGSPAIPFEYFHLNKDSGYMEQRAARSPDFNNSHIDLEQPLVEKIHAIERVVKDRSKAEGKTAPIANVLLFFATHEGRQRGVSHFVYSGRMTPQTSRDNRTGEGDPMFMYGEIPTDAYGKLREDIQHYPGLFEDVFDGLYSPSLTQPTKGEPAVRQKPVKIIVANVSPLADKRDMSTWLSHDQELTVSR